jgi:hypothetical protein
MAEPAISQSLRGATIAARQLRPPPYTAHSVLCLYCRTEKFVYWPLASRLRLANCPGCQRRAHADRDVAAVGASTMMRQGSNVM